MEHSGSPVLPSVSKRLTGSQAGCCLAQQDQNPVASSQGARHQNNSGPEAERAVGQERDSMSIDHRGDPEAERAIGQERCSMSIDHHDDPEAGRAFGRERRSMSINHRGDPEAGRAIGPRKGDNRPKGLEAVPAKQSTISAGSGGAAVTSSITHLAAVPADFGT
ncbi:hypothetical protein HF086_009732 [Spodoptera exigua]|uniref:Uncharacterized protein n=1 Tax=Spodoptera exigua TaxID=7107 RepID=A0A922SE26_SPOEX|nr:hypothetical protein HF086_009732 [Spodoptera exigua]